jgi:uncharacterized membrane protein
MNKFKTLFEYIFLFLVGGSVYYLIETLYKGITKGDPSHWSMFILGGICLVLVGLINQFYLTWNMSVIKQMFIGACIITTLEFITGCIVNLYFRWNVWDYSHLPLNLLGQICLPFSVIWFFLSGVAIFLDDYIRYELFDEEKPHYYI